MSDQVNQMNEEEEGAPLCKAKENAKQKLFMELTEVKQRLQADLT